MRSSSSGSVLSPRIISRILRNEPIVHRECLYRRSRATRTSFTRSRLVPLQQRRSLFGWISPVPREAILATGEKASLTYLKDACLRLDNQVRPPPADDLAKAWNILLKERRARKGYLNDGEALAVARVFELLKEMEAEKFKELIGDEALEWGMECLPVGATGEEEGGKAFLMLGRLLFEELRERVGGERLNASTSMPDHELAFWQKYITVITAYGRPEYARDLIATSGLPLYATEQLWVTFLQRLGAQGGKMEDADRLPSLIGEEMSLSDTMHKALSTFYASSGNMEEARIYTTIAPNDDGLLDASHITGLLTACRKHNDLTWGREIIKAITSYPQAMKSQKELWNGMFGFALATGKSVDEISRMMDVMRKTNPELLPETADINGLIVIANERKDPYMAERLVALGERWGCKADEETYLLQMDYRLSVDDVEGARTAFDHVKSFRHDGREDVDAGSRVNRLIQAMCARQSYAFEQIMDTVDFLGERGATFTAGTVSALSILHLNRDEYNDVADLLSTNIKDFSLADRASVRAAILDLMLDTSTPIPRLWDTYMIFQHVFDDAPRSERQRIMQSFFDRQRADMAIHVFNHMRRNNSPLVNPDTETYITALMGCGSCIDDESLAVVNNVLKLDISITETTRLHNARMISFFQTGDSTKAQAVWEDIVRSDEGPSRNSLVSIFRVCEQSDFGEVRARGVWKLCRRMDVPMDEEVVAAYVGALSGNGCEDEGRRIVEEVENGEVVGVEVGDLM